MVTGWFFAGQPERSRATAAKLFLRKALAGQNHPRPRVINVDNNPSYPKVTSYPGREAEPSFSRCEPVDQLPSGFHARQRCIYRKAFGGAAVSRQGHRLAYVKQSAEDPDIWQLSLREKGSTLPAPVRLISSTRTDSAPQYSPDGRQVAFESARSGVQTIWVSDADGSNPRKLVDEKEIPAGSPRWSPDGRRIAFDWSLTGSIRIYVVNAGGGAPIRLTDGPTDDEVPSWSHDGKWVYFASKRSGRFEIWKTAVSGDHKAVQVTSNGGSVVFESPNGRYIYYTKPPYDAIAVRNSLWMMPTGKLYRTCSVHKPPGVAGGVSWNRQP